MNTSGNKFLSGLQTVLLFLPLWLLLFYFRQEVVDYILYILFTVPVDATIIKALDFFLTTGIKIFLLLVLVIFLISFLRSWLPLSGIKNKLRSMPLIPANTLAGFAGVITPFCSCSAVPVFIGFLEAGIPLGVTFTFLIASPLVNEVILIMLAGLFGLRVAIIYLLTGLTLAIASGLIIDRLKLEKYLPSWLLTFRNEKQKPAQPANLASRISDSFLTVRKSLKSLWVYILAGLVAGALIQGYVPESFLTTPGVKDAWYAVPVAVITGIPLYACSAAVAPVAFALAGKGLSLGTALAFVMAVAGLSLPEMVMLKKVLSLKLILIFTAILFTGIIIIGYIFNLVL